MVATSVETVTTASPVSPLVPVVHELDDMKEPSHDRALAVLESLLDFVAVGVASGRESADQFAIVDVATCGASNPGCGR